MTDFGNSNGGLAAINVRIPSSADPTAIRQETSGDKDRPKLSSEQRSKPTYHMPSLSFVGGYRPTTQIVESVRKIERCWVNYRNRQMFRLLKTAVVAAEHSLTKEIMRKIAPKEAVFFKDDNSVMFKIRFRFGGSDFPPNIYFKIYVASDSGCALKYINGRKVIQPTSTASEDALRLMGSRLFYNQMLQDAMVRSDRAVVDEYEVATLKDYMQYCSLLDETPAVMGGKDNGWRRLAMDCLPRRTIFYDLVAFMNTKNVSQRLRSQLPFLLARPLTPEMAVEQLRLIVDVWPAEQQLLKQQQSAAVKHLLSSRSQETARRSRNALARAEKMRKAFTESPEATMPRAGTEGKEASIAVASGHPQSVLMSQADVEGGSTLRVQEAEEDEEEEDDWFPGEEEAGTLYQWTRELTLDDMVRTPRLPSDLTPSVLTPSAVPGTSRSHR